jgi:hypothetical protein
MAKRGRPRRPPRTDPAEIEKSHARADDEVTHRMAATFPPPPPLDPTVQAWSCDALNEMKSAGILRAPGGNAEDPSLLLGMGGEARSADRRHEIEKNIARWRAFRMAADRLVATEQWSTTEADEHMDMLGLLPNALAAALSRGEIGEQGVTDEQIDRYWPVPAKDMSAPPTRPNAPEGKPKRRRGHQELDFETTARRVLPSMPQWIRDAAFDSILYLYDEAPESMRPKIEDIKPELVKLRDALTSLDLPLRLAKRAAALWDIVRCAAWAEGDIRDPHGARPALIHYANVSQRMKAFTASCPTNEKGQVKIPRDMALRLFVPAFNATHSHVRRCLECGAEFALRDDHERMNSKYCSGGNKKCANKVSSRKAKAAARKAGDVLHKMRERYKGDAAVERAEREMANPYDAEDALIDIIDAARKGSDEK